MFGSRIRYVQSTHAPVERAPFCVPMYPLIYDDLQHWLWNIFLNPMMKLIEVAGTRGLIYGAKWNLRWGRRDTGREYTRHHLIAIAQCDRPRDIPQFVALSNFSPSSSYTLRLQPFVANPRSTRPTPSHFQPSSIVP